MIVLPRGNTLELAVTVTDENGSIYKLAEGDTAMFTVKAADGREETPIIQKLLTAQDMNKNGEIEFRIAPEETISLEKGYYLFDFAVCISGEDFYTAVLTDSFKILPALGDKEAVPI